MIRKGKMMNKKALITIFIGFLLCSSVLFIGYKTTKAPVSLYRVYLEGASNYMGVDSLSANDKKIASDVLINEVDIKNNKLIATSNTYIGGGNTIIEHKKDSFITYDK